MSEKDVEYYAPVTMATLPERSAIVAGSHSCGDVKTVSSSR